MAYTRQVTNIDPYWDDFTSYRNFLRILFKPGRAVQARELTQMQTAAQWQVEQMASHIFADGSSIVGARVEVTKDAPYIEILAEDVVEKGTSTQIADPQLLVGQHIHKYDADINNPSGALAKIIAVDNNSGTLRLQLDYRGGEFAVQDKFVTVNYADGDAVNFPTKYQTSAVAATDTITAIGTGMRASVDEGVIYLNGFFVEILPQEIFVTKTGVTGTFVIGYEYEEFTLEAEDTTTVDPVDGVTLLGSEIRDPAGTTNQGAPGADRYMVTAHLRGYEVGVDTIPDTFHQIIKTTDGVLEEKIDKTEYADILDLLAGRTYDESGSYTVEPYGMSAAYFDQDNLNYIIGPGKSYAFGFERENISPVKVSASKTRATRGYGSGDLAAENRSAIYGTYVRARIAPSPVSFNALNDVEVGAVADTIRTAGHSFAVGDKVLYSNGGGTTLTGLTNNTTYYVIVIDKDTIKLATSPTNATAGTSVTGLATGIDENHSLTYEEQSDDVFDATAFDQVHLMSGYSGCGESLGTARVWFANDIAGRTHLYLGDNPKLAADLSTCRSLCSVGTGSPTPGTDTFMNIEEFNPAIQVVGFNQPILELASFVKAVTNVNYVTLLKITKTVTTASYTLSSGNADDTFAADPYDSIVLVVKSDGEVIDPEAGVGALGTATGGSTDTITATAPHSLAAGTYDFYMIVDRANAIPRTKTLTEPAFFDIDVAGADISTLILNGTNNGSTLTGSAPSYFDVSAIESIIEDPLSAATDVTANYLLDTGQKDIYYDYSSINGTFKANTKYRITLHYWAWGGTGDFFAANSYLKGSDTYYDDKGGYLAHIPAFVNENQSKEYLLRDCLDFRRNVTELTTAREIAAPTTTVELTYEHYLPRWDRVFIDRDGKFGVTEGVAEEFPSLPPEVSGTMTLFDVFLLPYLYDPEGTDVEYGSDQVTIRTINQKNYTMMDIRGLEERLSNLEQYSAETQLELGAYADTVVDVDGFPRSKNGFFVDKFTDHRKGSVWETTYRCSMDPNEGALRTPFRMDQIQFEYDDDSATSALQTNNSEKLSPWENTITLGVNSIESWLEQPEASEYMNINPFSVVVWAGEVLMKPASDTWIETRYAPTEQIHDADEAARIRALYDRSDETGIPTWGAWQTQIIGVSRTSRQFNGSWRRNGGWFAGRLRPAVLRQETITTTSQSTRTGTELIESGSRTITQDMGERLVDTSSIPWMRTIDIVFEAFGLRPDTTMVPYFGGNDVSANVTWDAGNPGGVTKHNGYLKGTFTVPEKTFKTGKNVFTLKDTVTDPHSIASTEFRAEGTLYTRAKQIMSVEVPTYSTRTITEQERSVDVETGDTTFVRWRDPISQTFLVEDEGGVFLESIDVFFATKDRYIPVSLYIVETIAGVPGQKRVPFSFVTMDADNVTATRYDEVANNIKYNGDHYDTDGTNLVHSDGDVVTGSPTDFVATKFSFKDPVYLKEGVEYAFVLMSNSNNYNAYISRMGQFQLIKNLGQFNGAGITKQPHLGSLLKSQNTSTWTPDQYADIKFEMHRCDFDKNTASALYMRVAGQWDYWDDIVYAPGDQVIYNHGTDGLSVYECLEATTASAGEHPDTGGAPAKWSRVQDGFLLATLLNISTDELIIPGTSITRQYLSDPDTTWIDFTNKEDIPLTAQDTIELYTDNQTQNPSAPKGINLKINLSSENTWLSPVINKGRSFAAIINNLVRDTDADAPASHTAKFDAGEYISETVILKQPASSMKLLIDVQKPNDDAIIVPKYRTIKEPIRYIDRDSALTTGENELSDQIDMQDRFGYVYHMNLSQASWSGATISTWTEKGSVVIDGLDSDQGRLYVSSISNPENFGDKTVIPGGLNPWILVTTEPDIDSTEITMWDGSSVTAGYYAFNPTDHNLYRAEVTTVAEPSATGLDWTLIGSVIVDGDIQLDQNVDWRPMQLVGSVSPGVDTTQFVEYEYEPLITPSEGFENFAIKIEMYCGDAVNVPVCKRLRVIAVD